MGVNCNVFFPTDVRSNDLAMVAGVLAGLPHHIEDIGRPGDPCIVVRVDGAREEVTVSPGMVDIVLTTPENKTFLDGEKHHTTYFHYSSRHNGKIWNAIHPTANPFWCAVSLGLVRWFGGILVYNDCKEAKGKNIVRAKRSCPVDRAGLPDRGKPWGEYQTALNKLKSITAAELRRADRMAAYKLAEYATAKV